ncbi:helix-turn-helix domain-containing protein [Halopenitus sp. H-Gu1]|uniref:helix-turn-helix domain-containing protein n=1 Tax=Halopenitus sp. H-Gu1 TaxID=3242697 RepID=UPI00359D5C21
MADLRAGDHKSDHYQLLAILARLLWLVHKVTGMPISIERFKEKPDERLNLEDGTPADRISTFLAEHDDRAFTRTEIAARLGIRHRTVGTVLSQLEDEGFVRNKGRHWTIVADAGDPPS